VGWGGGGLWLEGMDNQALGFHSSSCHCIDSSGRNRPRS
jgi:hypothetical protein